MKNTMHGSLVTETDDSDLEAGGPLCFWVMPSGDAPYKIDLTLFADGGRREDVTPSSRAAWTRDFSGRPIFALEIAELIRRRRPTKTSAASIVQAFRKFFRFLDTTPLTEDSPCIEGVMDIVDSHGPAFLTWVGDDVTSYQTVKTMLDRILEMAGARMLYWTKRPRIELTVNEPVDTKGLQRLFHALRHEGRSIKRMFAEGQRLAAAGTDPRGLPEQTSPWSSGANRAWLVHHLTVDNPIDTAELLRCRNLAFKWQFSVPEASWPDFGLAPTYVLPGMNHRYFFSLGGAVRWFHPGYYDTAVFLWLFLIGTGWNLSTALSIDVTDEDSWFQPHPHSAEFAVIHAFKNRAERHQFTLSMTKPEWHPYRVLRYMIDQTRSLRASVQIRLDAARIAYQAHRSPSNLAVVHDLETAARSPWLYASSNTLGKVSYLGKSDVTRLNSLARDLADKHGLAEKHPSLKEVTTAAARDAWIGHAYVRSGYHVLLTRLASQHASAKTLRYYLRSRRYREHSELQVRKVQDAVFAEIAGGRVLDPTRLRLLVRNGAISAAQERRLLDIRQRTRLGMGCLDPTSPPRQIAPEHKEGSLCRVQRCTGCRHGVVFEESRPALARAYAELIFIQRTIPMAAWEGSSFEEEKASLEQTLANFDRGAVNTEVDAWLVRFKSGEEIPHDTYPSY